MALGVCRFCQLESKLAKSHIVPRSFYSLDHELPHMLLRLGDDVERPKRSNTGLWDDNILCDDCEAIFAGIDGYAFEHLIGRSRKFFVCRDGNGNLALDGALPLVIYTHASPINLKTFAISVLWRACVSERPEMEGVKSEREGGYLESLKSENFEGFELAMCRDTNFAWHGFVCVVGDWEIDGVHFDRFSAGGYMFLIRSAGDKKSDSLESLFYKYQGYQTALCRSELESAFAIQMAGAARKIRSAFGDPWRGLRKGNSNG